MSINIRYLFLRFARPFRRKIPVDFFGFFVRKLYRQSCFITRYFLSGFYEQFVKLFEQKNGAFPHRYF